MGMYLMFGNYTMEGMKGISTNRTQEAVAVIGDCGGKMVAGYALLGKVDMVGVMEFPDIESAMKASMGLSKLLGMSFTTSPAVSIEKFDELFG